MLSLYHPEIKLFVFRAQEKICIDMYKNVHVDQTRLLNFSKFVINMLTSVANELVLNIAEKFTSTQSFINIRP